MIWEVREVKKLFIAVVFLFLCICSGAMAEHTHTWKTVRNNESHWQECTVCGEITEKEEHYVMCDAVWPYRCVVCDLPYQEGVTTMYKSHYIHEDSVLISQHYHSLECKVCNTRIFDEAHYAACVAPETCLACGCTVEEDGIVIDQIVHLWAMNGDAKEHWEVCLLCGATQNREAHYISCSAQTKDVCSGCGMPKADGAEIHAIGHNYPEESIQHDAKTHWYVCADCGERSTPEPHTSTCGNTSSCAVCHASASDGAEIPFVDHIWEITWDRDQHYKICSVCKHLDDGSGFHYALCDAEDTTVCAFCGQKEGDIDISEIQHSKPRNDFDELKHFVICDACGEILDQDLHYTTCSFPDACMECGAKAADGAIFEVEHSPGGEFLSDETHHWLLCEDCGEVQMKDLHVGSCGERDRCFVCGAREDEGYVIGRIYHPSAYPMHDDEKHWQFCDRCGERIQEEKHTFNELGLCSGCNYKAPVEPEVLPTYAMQDIRYDGAVVTGKLIQTAPGKPNAGPTGVRVTFFITGNYYMATVSEIEPDGAFAVEGVGPIEYISLVAFGENDVRFAMGDIMVAP